MQMCRCGMKNEAACTVQWRGMESAVWVGRARDAGRGEGGGRSMRESGGHSSNRQVKQSWKKSCAAIHDFVNEAVNKLGAVCSQPQIWAQRENTAVSSSLHLACINRRPMTAVLSQPTAVVLDST